MDAYVTVSFCGWNIHYGYMQNEAFLSDMMDVSPDQDHKLFEQLDNDKIKVSIPPPFQCSSRTGSDQEFLLSQGQDIRFDYDQLSFHLFWADPVERLPNIFEIDYKYWSIQLGFIVGCILMLWWLPPPNELHHYSTQFQLLTESEPLVAEPSKNQVIEQWNLSPEDKKRVFKLHELIGEYDISNFAKAQNITTKQAYLQLLGACKAELAEIEKLKSDADEIERSMLRIMLEYKLDRILKPINTGSGTTFRFNSLLTRKPLVGSLKAKGLNCVQRSYLQEINQKFGRFLYLRTTRIKSSLRKGISAHITINHSGRVEQLQFKGGSSLGRKRVERAWRTLLHKNLTKPACGDSTLLILPLDWT